MLDFTFVNHLKNQTLGKDFFYNILKKATLHSGFNKKEIGLSLNLVSKGKIKTLNQKYRKINKETDVLSFSTSAKTENSDIIELGDIFICLSIAKMEAQKENKNLKNQLELLTVHGFLHLLGFDHQTQQQEQKMSALQNKILKK